VLPLIIVAAGDLSEQTAAAGDPPLRGQLVDALRHRFGGDYEVVGIDPERVLDLLSEMSSAGRTVAAVVAGSNENPGGNAAVGLLAKVRARSAGTRRILLVQRGGWRTHPVREAMVLGHVDGYLFIPWAQREQWLYLPMSEYLAAWERSRPPAQTAFRVIGRQHDQRSHALRDILSRVEIPHEFLNSESAAGREALAREDQDGSVLPVLVHHRGEVLLDPSDLELIEILGFSRAPAHSVWDVAIVGAGPSGLSAAVYAASEGLRTVVIDPSVPGGQAGTSSMIRNYLGFPHGLSGSELTNRAVEQAWLFGAEFLLAERVVAIGTEDRQHRLTLSSGAMLLARTVVIASGVSWRRLGVPSLEALLGAGVFYGAAASEAAALHDQDVIVVGGGNSAGQAAAHLAKHAARVLLVVRRDGLAATMSDYLVQEIAGTPNIRLRTGSQVVDGGGAGHLEWVTIETGARRESAPATALFVMIGAEPRTDWLPDTVQRDSSGYLLVGNDVIGQGWPLSRPPMFLETSVPGVFAVGDVVHNSTKRVAPSVGTGAVAIELIHRHLAS
jgi:thioredoxin reductase (NADPH)